MTLAQVAGLFTAPLLAGIGAAAVSIPIIIHLMSRFRRKPEAWGAMRFLIEAYQKQRKRLQIEKLLLLLVRCMVVLLAGLALAGPVLSGCSSNQLSLGGSAGRVVYIVIDDALSSQTREAGTTRLEQHQAEALNVISEMSQADRAVIVRMARPTEVVLDEPTSDTSALKKAIESIKPRYSRGDLRNALTLIDTSMRELGVRAGDAVVVLLSDFPASAKYFQEQLPPELEGFGERASIVTALPPKGTDNVQVLSVIPRRSVVVAEPTGTTMIGGRVELLRYGGVDQEQAAKLQVKVLASDGKVMSETQRLVRWPIGERQRRINFDLPVQLSADSLAGLGQDLVIQASLQPEVSGAGLDVLDADDQAVSVIRLRDRLQVAVVDDGERLNEEVGGFQANQWVRAALTPQGAGMPGPFELVPLMPSSLKAETLEPVDAVIVLRPDEVTALGWDALSAFSKRGGLVWVFAPAREADPTWAEAMKLAYTLPWTFGSELATVVAEGEQAPSVPLDATTLAPEPLQFLAADWREKLGWVSVQTWLPFSTPVEDQWIVLDQATQGPLQGRAVLMAQHQAGQGALLFVATALDTRFTNLPIRALFVPLMHDTLRGVLGSLLEQPAIVSGDQVDLGRRWAGAGELTRLAIGGNQSGDALQASLLINTEDDTAALRDAAVMPGIYKDVDGSSPLLAINVDASAGDTIGGQRELELFLDQLGGWAYLSDRRDAGGILSEVTRGTDLTALLLWALLVLVLLETALARWFSHATDHSTPTVVGRALGALHGGSYEQPRVEVGRDA